MKCIRLWIGAVLVAGGVMGCSDNGELEAGMPAGEFKGVAPTLEAKPISAKDMPKVKKKGPAVPVPGRA
ncbi:hypothetical protein [Singulisphaera sp. PoT]|uniref:hypothetical protein n=1 Tax=Singulisphaera sp. PoT TaxID=3411797 RepID=UPI003BF58B08